jgi:hypothetical protein
MPYAYGNGAGLDLKALIPTTGFTVPRQPGPEKAFSKSASVQKVLLRLSISPGIDCKALSQKGFYCFRKVLSLYLEAYMQP